MKILQKLGSYVLVASMVVLGSCNNDDGGGGGSTSGYHVNAKVDGQDYSNSNLFAPSAIITNGILNIQSSDNSGNAISIQVPNYTGLGTYNSGNNNIMNGYINYMKAGATIGQFTSYTSVRGDGVVTITEETDTEVVGTFSATAFENVDNSTNSVEITEGSFRADL